MRAPRRSRWRRRGWTLPLLALLIAVPAACGGGAEYAVLDRQAHPLRDRFNGQAEDVRILMLLAPT